MSLIFMQALAIVNAPIGNQFVLEKLVVSVIDDGIEHHCAHRQLLHPRPAQRGRGQAFGETAAQVGGRIRARDLVEKIADIVRFGSNARSPPSIALSSPCEKLGNMNRIYLLLLLAAPLLTDSRPLPSLARRARQSDL